MASSVERSASYRLHRERRQRKSVFEERPSPSRGSCRCRITSSFHLDVNLCKAQSLVYSAKEPLTQRRTTALSSTSSYHELHLTHLAHLVPSPGSWNSSSRSSVVQKQSPRPQPSEPPQSLSCRGLFNPSFSQILPLKERRPGSLSIR